MYRFLSNTAIVTALCMGVTSVSPVSAQSVAGPYLAARQASVQSDYGVAAEYYVQALAQDPGNPELLESAALSYLSLGEIDKALPLARQMEADDQKSQIGRLVITAGLIAEGDYAALQAREASGDGIGPWVEGLAQAWSYVGSGDMTRAMDAFDDMSNEAAIKSLVLYHKAMALASQGEFAQADAILASEAAGAAARTRRGVLAHAEILSQLGRNDDALLLIRENFGNETDPELERLLERLQDDNPMPFQHIPDVRAGMAEVYFTFASVLRSEEAGDYYTLLYARIARYLRPDHIDALLLTAGLLESLDQNALAIAEYKAVPADNPAYHAAEMGRAAALRRMGQLDQAVEVLEQLARSHGGLAVVHSTMGDLLVRQDKFEAAIDAYSRALELTPPEANSRWILHYARGIAEERSDDWESSEADFRAALAINGNQPQVLNYLGYSLVEQNRKLDEALDMIERAVAGSPGSGYIVDSLGWVYYRLGRYEEAVTQMERAVELLAVDPVVNDHLGDVYWAVGREREAQFQWRRALSFLGRTQSDTEVEPDRIRRKLEVGLDAVLEEEGEPPLKVVNDG